MDVYKSWLNFFLFVMTFVPLSLFSEVRLSGDKKNKYLFIDQAIATFMHQHSIPGVAVAIFDNGEERFFFYGIADKASRTKITENTIFEIASITKVFTTTALALHVLQGDMVLKDPISKYIPGLDKSAAISRVTLLDLATHTSSLPRVGGNWKIGGVDKIHQFLQHWKPNDPIGTHYDYSNLGFGLLGFALENVEKRTYDEVIRHDILLPLGMNMTFTEVPQSLLSQYAQGYTIDGKKALKRKHGYIPGSGAIRSTAKDLLKFLKANMGLTGPVKLLKAMQLAQQPYFKVRDHFFMGLGWQRFDIKGQLIIDKNGGVSGFTSYIGWIPEKRVGIVILTNKGKSRATQIGRNLLIHLSR
jgi:beta-lactamase class C